MKLKIFKSDFRLFVLCGFLSVLLSGFVGQAHANEQANWDAVKSGQAIALMRHALAPGTGDPSNFLVSDCSTQRNLSAEGRAQSMRIGNVMKASGIVDAQVYSSQWCRCIDTGTGLGFDAPQELPLMNSFFQDRSTASAQTDELTNWIKNRLENADSNPKLPAVLVTHQVNISALINAATTSQVYPRSGEVVFISLDKGELVVLGTYLME